MAQQKTRSERVRLITGAAIGLLAIIGLVGSLEQAACILRELFGNPMQVALAMLPSAVEAGWRVMQPGALDQQQCLGRILEISACCGQFLLSI